MDWLNDLPAPKDIEARTRPLNTRTPGPQVQRVAQIPPFWQLRPPAGVDLFARVSGQLAAGAGSTLDLTPARSFTTLPQYSGVLQSLVIQVSAPLVTLDVVFTLLKNGAPVEGWDNLQVPNVAANAIIFPFNGPLQLGERSTLTVRATNNNAVGPWDLGVSLAGWQWPRVAEIEAFGYFSA